MADGGWLMADGGWRMAARTQTVPSSAVRWLILKPGYRTDLGRASNAPRLDAREEGGFSAYSERSSENPLRAETGAKRGMTVGRQPASTGRLRAGRPETRVNSGLAGRQAGNARKQWAVGQGLRKRPFYAGFRAGVVAIVIVDLWQFLTAGGGDSTGDAPLPHGRQCKARYCRSADSRSDASPRSRLLAGKGTTHFFVAALPIYCLRILDVTPGYLNRLTASPRQQRVCGQAGRKPL